MCHPIALDVPDFGGSVGTHEDGVLAPASTYPHGFLPPHTHTHTVRTQRLGHASSFSLGSPRTEPTTIAQDGEALTPGRIWYRGPALLPTTGLGRGGEAPTAWEGLATALFPYPSSGKSCQPYTMVVGPSRPWGTEGAPVCLGARPSRCSV